MRLKSKSKAAKKTQSMGKNTTAKRHTQMPLDVTNDVTNEAAAIDGLQNAETAVSNVFFYTNDKFLTSLDNDEIMQTVVARYPKFAVSNTDTEIKSALVEMLNDAAFMSSLLKHYSISIYDFVKMMNKNYGMLFKGTFLKKVRMLLCAYEV